MKPFLQIFVAVLLAAGLALFLYDQFVLAPRLQKAGEAAHVSLGEAREQARDIASELDTRVGRSVAEAKSAFEQQARAEDARRTDLELQAERMQLAAQVGDALARAATLKVAVAEFYMEQGQWPSALVDLGLGRPADFEGGAVSSIAIESGGVVVVATKPEIADGGRIRLLPRAAASGNIEWSCRINGIRLAERLGNCEH